MSFEFNLYGSTNNIQRALKRLSELEASAVLEKYGQIGVSRLAAATPVDSGKTAAAWDYSVRKGGSGAEIHFTNSNINKGVNIAIIIQTGHGTGTGGYVQGVDYINPAMRQVFESLVKEILQELK